MADKELPRLYTEDDADDKATVLFDVVEEEVEVDSSVEESLAGAFLRGARRRVQLNRVEPLAEGALPGPVPQRPCLVVVGGNRSLGRIIPVRDGMTLGRATSCDVVLDEEGVSRKHAALLVDATGVVHIADLGSSNGVLHAGAKVASAVMRDGERFQVGDAAIALLHIDDLNETLASSLVGLAIDAETKLPLRHMFLETLAREYHFAMRYKAPLSVALFTIDDLKASRTVALRHLAVAISTLLARDDILVARYDEDHLAVLLPETPLANAHMAAQSICRGMDPARWSVRSGVACTSEKEVTSAATLVEQAERKIHYRAKATGQPSVG